MSAAIKGQKFLLQSNEYFCTKSKQNRSELVARPALTLQSLFDEEFVVERASLCEPSKLVFLTGMSHSNREVKSKTHNKWSSTYGKALKEEDQPSDIRKLVAEAGLSRQDSFR